jgi:hypothetical protein
MSGHHRCGKHLKIVVPYRDRAGHLRDFLPHIREYLADSDIAYHIVIAEQDEGLPFNRGAIKNAGFLLGGASDYTCFHDVDYLPLNADYGWTDDPACLVLVGAEGRPVKTGGAVRRIQLDKVAFFGGAVMMPDDLFRRVNGYSNDYWGWGFEDTDLARRFASSDIACVRRPGVFCPLPHDSHGYEADGGMNADAARNRTRYMRKWDGIRRADDEGLSTLCCELVSRQMLVPPVNGSGHCEHIKVRLFRQEKDAPVPRISDEGMPAFSRLAS